LFFNRVWSSGAGTVRDDLLPLRRVQARRHREDGALDMGDLEDQVSTYSCIDAFNRQIRSSTDPGELPARAARKTPGKLRFWKKRPFNGLDISALGARRSTVTALCEILTIIGPIRNPCTTTKIISRSSGTWFCRGALDRGIQKAAIKRHRSHFGCVQRAGLQPPRSATQNRSDLDLTLDRGEAHRGSGGDCGRETSTCSTRTIRVLFGNPVRYTDAPGPAGRGLVDADLSGDEDPFST